jgi:hypothetical protein
VLLYEKTLRQQARRDLRQLALIAHGMAGGDGYKELHAALKRQAGG